MNIINYKEELRIARMRFRELWEKDGLDSRALCGLHDEDYDILIEYIIKNKPKCIVEYGSGESTYIIKTLTNLLGYECYIYSYEDTPYWYDKIISAGIGKMNGVFVQLCDIEHFREDCEVVRYIHEYDFAIKPELVIIDGPDLRNFNPTADTTRNLLDIYEIYGDDIPYWIDGRSGTKEYYDRRGYLNLRIDV